MRIALVILSLFLLISCQQRPADSLLVGAWKVDSTQKIYPPFNHTTYAGSDFATYLYLPDEEVFEIRDSLFRRYAYQFLPDSQKVVFLRPNGKRDEFDLLKINQERMILKKHLPAIFEKDNSDRYEIRFFSKIDSTGISASLTQELKHY